MASNYNHSAQRGHRARPEQRQRLASFGNSNQVRAEMILQQDINQQLIDPGDTNLYVDPFSPTSTSSQSFAALQPASDDFFSSASLNVPIRNVSQAFSPYMTSTPVPQSISFNTGLGFDAGIASHGGGGVRNRTNSFGPHLHIPTSTPTNSPYAFGPPTTATPTFSIPQYSPPQLASPVSANANTFYYPPTASATHPMQRTPSIVEPRKRARHSSPSPSSSSSNASSPTSSFHDPSTTSPVIGHVLANKRFKCSETSCATLTFNRQADLRRHYENRHARRDRQDEVYCPVKGCGRSMDVGGRRGRSFGVRRDKRDEHLRTVHKMNKSM